MFGTKLEITLLADEWNSTKGGLSTLNRELAIQLAKYHNVAVTLFVPKCTEEERKAAGKHNIRIVEATERPDYDPLDWLSFPPRDLVCDVIIGHGVKLGKQAQVIRDYHNCSCWLQVVHTVPEELAMFKTYSGAISQGDEKQWAEVKLCTIADLVVAVGPKLHDIYSRYLSRSEKNVINLTPGILAEFSDLKQSTQGSKKFWVLVFGRGDSEDFELKGFDIAARAVAELNNKSYHLIFVGAPSGKGDQVAGKLLKQGLSRGQLTVKGFLENREDLRTLSSTANLAVVPSRTEGFGLTALEALSAGLPFLVSQNSGFGEALQEIPFGSSWIVDSEDPKRWAEGIKGVREKGSETARKECQELRSLYAEKYSWEKQCNGLVEIMLILAHDEAKMPQPVCVSEPEKNRLEDNSVQPSGEKSSLQEDKPITEQKTAVNLFSGSNNVKQRSKLHLFSCDRNFNLDAVEGMLVAIKAQLGFYSVEKHYFSLDQLSDVTTNIIPKLQMDMAFFAVHADVSRLLINTNENIGYAKIYRALLQATDENVLTVIGGDDQYSNRNEEERCVIPRWARRKIFSQFQEEFMDGRKSFIFSWNKKHRVIHEEALLHYFDPCKKGQKFEYHPKTPSEVSTRGKESEAPNKMMPQEGDDRHQEEVEDNTDRHTESSSSVEKSKQVPETAVTPGQMPDVEDDEVMLGEEIQPHSLGQDYVHLNAARGEDFTVVEMSVANNTGVQPETKTEVETLLVKIRLRYGQLTDRDDDKVVWGELWTPPDDLLPEIFNKFKNVADADMEIYRVESTAVIRIKIKDNTRRSIIYAIIEIVSNVITWITDNTKQFFQRAGSSEAEINRDVAEKGRPAVVKDSEEGFAVVNIEKRE